MTAVVCLAPVIDY